MEWLSHTLEDRTLERLLRPRWETQGAVDTPWGLGLCQGKIVGGVAESLETFVARSRPHNSPRVPHTP